MTNPITRTWPNSVGTYLAGRAYLDEADATAAEMEAKWGAGRLRLLVEPALREKFDRQRYLLNQAVWHGKDVESVRREAGRMVKAWFALDKAATAAGKAKLDPLVWEVPLEDGTVAAIVPDNFHAERVNAESRRVHVYTLEEIARLLHGYKGLAKIKMEFPGATVIAVRRNAQDPLEHGMIGIESDQPIDDPLEDPIPF